MDNKYGLLLMFQYLVGYRAYYKRLNLLRKVVEIDNYVVVAIELEALGESGILSLRENSSEEVSPVYNVLKKSNYLAWENDFRQMYEEYRRTRTYAA